METKKFEIGKELEDLLYPLEPKIRAETNIGVFTQQEQLIMYSAYKNINGSIPPKNCNGCFKALKKSLTNWFNLYPKGEIENLVNIAKALKENLDEEVKTFNETKEIEDTKEIVKQVRKPRMQKDGWTRVVNIKSLGIDGKHVNLKVEGREVKNSYQATFDGEVWSFTDSNEVTCREWEGEPSHFRLVNK